MGEQANAGEDNCRAYGQYLGQRYAGFDNIVWMHGNDYQDWGPDSDRFTTAVARGIKDFDGRHLHTVELNFFVSSSTDDPAWAPIIQLNAAYTYDPVYVEILKDYNRGDGLPVFLVEAGYEFEIGDSRTMRSQAYWAVLSGATGQLYGNRYVWPFVDGWPGELNSPGAVQMVNFTALFQSRPWYDLVPDQDHSVVTSGRGDFGSRDYVTAARTPDGRLVMAYVPTARTVTVDMGRLSGPAVARWYDPASGAFAAISDSALPNRGLVAFTTPGDNAEGPSNEDWILVLEAGSGSTPSFIELSTASDAYGPGAQLEVFLRAFNGAPQSPRELFVGVLVPDRHTVVYFTGPNVIGGSATVQSLGDLRPLASLAPGQLLDLSGGTPVVTFRVPAGIPSGTYTWFAVLAGPGTLADGFPHPGDVDVLALRTIELRP